MVVTTTNLGVITAYGDAVAAGYTGTKAEWQALMASYATVAEEANQAKDDAVSAKNTAVAKATEATTAATNANTAKDTATSKATEATTAANTATTKANEASASAQSIAQSAAQIQENTDDISQLKSDLTDVNAELADLRVGADGTVYASAGVAVRSQINNLNEYVDIFTENVDESVQNWLDEHPEATTTVQDGSVTNAKLADEVRNLIITTTLTGEKTANPSSGNGYITQFSGEKGNVIALATAWKNTSFKYKETVTRNDYATASDCFDNGQLLMNCSTFALMIWAGISPNSFSAYDGSITKAFDWGYWFDFILRQKAYGLTNSSGNYFNYSEASKSSSNSYYSENSSLSQNQVFKDYMYACDMALELYIKGCEIKPSELDVGDLMFFEANHLHDNANDDFEQMAFRRINHVAVVIDKSYNGYLRFAEIQGGTSAVAFRSLGQSGAGDRVRTADLLNRLVMCARHPHAMLGIAGNTPNNFTVI